MRSKSLETTNSSTQTKFLEDSLIESRLRHIAFTPKYTFQTIFDNIDDQELRSSSRIQYAK